MIAPRASRPLSMGRLGNVEREPPLTLCTDEIPCGRHVNWRRILAMSEVGPT